MCIFVTDCILGRFTPHCKLQTGKCPRSCFIMPFIIFNIFKIEKICFPIQAALAGLMGEIIYAPYDITGAKFIWWTWHDTDAPIRDRLFGAPVGSSSWVITFSCSFQLIWRFLLSDDQVKIGKDLSLSGAMFKLVISAVLTTPLMMIQMAFFQLISGDSQGLPTIRTFSVCIGLYLAFIYVLPV